MTDFVNDCGAILRYGSAFVGQYGRLLALRHPPSTTLILLSVIDNLRDTNASMWKIYLLYIFIFEDTLLFF
jgi:hypothetical protein